MTKQKMEVFIMCVTNSMTVAPNLPLLTSSLQLKASTVSGDQPDPPHHVSRLLDQTSLLLRGTGGTG